MAINRAYATGTITSFVNGTGRILPDGDGQPIPFHMAACKNFEPAVGDRVRYVYTSSVEVVYLEDARLGGCSHGLIKRDAVRR
jgi:hypothetical protein